MATKKTKTTTAELMAGTATATSGTEIVTTDSNEGSTGVVTAAPVFMAGATSSQDPASATGEEQPGGTNSQGNDLQTTNTQGDDADATGKVTEPENPEPALTVNEAAANPEAEASVSGILSSAEQFLQTGVVSATGIMFDGIFLSNEDIAEIVAQAFKDAIAARQPIDIEVRSFELLKGVILHNKIVDTEIVHITRTEHAVLVEQGAVLPDWDADALETDR